MKGYEDTNQWTKIGNCIYEIASKISEGPIRLHLTRWELWGQWVNSLWPSDAIWRQRSGTTLAQVMDCCLTAASHYLNQCWLIIKKVLWRIHFRVLSQEIRRPSVTRISLKIIHQIVNQIRGQWVRFLLHCFAVCLQLTPHPTKRYASNVPQKYARISENWPNIGYNALSQHWNKNIVILTKFSSPVAPEVVNDMSLCSQWRKFRQNNDISIQWTSRKV